MRLFYVLALLPIWCVSAMMLLALGVLFFYAFHANPLTILPLVRIYISNSLILVLGTGLCAGILGTVTAMLTSFYRFPLSQIMQWALFLPFAIPSYIIAYRMQDFMDYTGPVQSLMRDYWEVSWLPDGRSLFGLIVLFTLVLYPYVYLLARTAFHKHTHIVIEAARLMGYSYWRALLVTAIPLCWPALIAGISLVLLETLNEYGAVALSSVPTLSVGIVDLWWSLGDAAASSQLAMIVLMMLIFLYYCENLGRGNRRFYQMKQPQPHRSALPRLTHIKGYIALGFCMLPIFFGFLLPLFLLVMDSLSVFFSDSDFHWQDYVSAIGNSLFLAVVTASFAIMLGMIAGYILRKNYLSRYWVRLLQAGYALPGTLLAIGLLLGFAVLNDGGNSISQWLFNRELPFYIGNGVVLLIIAYICRFSHISISGIHSHMQTISPHLDEAASTLGRKPASILRRIHLPLLDSGIIAAFLLILVDVLKELPASLLLRPLNFDTLAVHVFEYAIDERIENAAPGALIIVLTGLFPVIYLSYLMDRDHHG